MNKVNVVRNAFRKTSNPPPRKEVAPVESASKGVKVCVVGVRKRA